MYLHLGQNFVIPFRDVVGIFDLDKVSTSHRTRGFLKRAQEEGWVVDVSLDLPKAMVLCRDSFGEEVVYLSQLSSATLLRRVESGGFSVG